VHGVDQPVRGAEHGEQVGVLGGEEVGGYFGGAEEFAGVLSRELLADLDRAISLKVDDAKMRAERGAPPALSQPASRIPSLVNSYAASSATLTSGRAGGDHAPTGVMSAVVVPGYHAELWRGTGHGLNSRVGWIGCGVSWQRYRAIGPRGP